jgi:alginate O-acetyltransferase complex protein AlgI
MALLVDPIYNSPTTHTGPALVFATLAFAIQIYCDFSGYSDIALGSAQVMGIKLMKNFDHPYFSKSVSEFWERWHISLSTWFRDYLYIPLGGNRVPKLQWVFNLLITFLISGLWHGANWTFAIWGALHGLYVIVFGLTEKLRTRFASALRMDRFQKLTNALSTFTTFSLVSYAWIFFRANNLSDALYISKGFFSGWGDYIVQIKTILFGGVGLAHVDATLNSIFNVITPFTIESRSFIVITILALFVWLIVEIKQFRGNFLGDLSLQPAYIRWVLYSLIITLTLVFGTTYTGAQRPFIYFQF